MNGKSKGLWFDNLIIYDRNLKWPEKALIITINNLDNKDGCFASNNAFAKFIDVSPGRISQMIGKLIEQKYISAEYIREGKEIKKRVLRILNRGIKNTKGGIENTKEGYLENDKGNNIKSNNIINNIKTEDPEIQEIIDFWNDKQIISHTNKAVNKNLQKKHLETIKDVGKFGVLRAIQNYKEVLESSEHFFSYKWSLWDFIQRGLENFRDEYDPLTNYLIKKNKRATVDHEENTRMVEKIKAELENEL
jgi:hypothetical protein